MIDEYGIGYFTVEPLNIYRAIGGSAANEAFGKFLSTEKLSAAQVRFVGLIVDYIAANGMIEDNRVLTEEPFRSLGSITALFADKMQAAKELMDVIAKVKRNCEHVV